MYVQKKVIKYLTKDNILLDCLLVDTSCGSLN